MTSSVDNQVQTQTGNQTISADGIDRRGFLKCMAWAGTGLVWTFAGGVPTSRAFGESAKPSAQSDFTFVQISDSHIGFNKPANTDVTATLQAALSKIDAAPSTPDFLIHTGDLTHSSKPAEFDTLNQLLTSRRQVFYVPGEHDTSVDDGKLYLERYGKGTTGNGWYSFDHKGVHFIGLVNVVQLEGMGRLGQAQIDWLKQDLHGVKSSVPIVVFAHIPLWAVYPEWGWGTSDSEQAFALLPGSAPSPGPMKVSADRLQSVLGITNLNFVAQRRELAIVDATLSGINAESRESSR
jgi:3',5'-cyclic-AMP phosphodiesterase